VGVVRVALLSYRSDPCSGGQGVYVRNLSRELVALGHEVEVFSGPPYPELDDGVALTRERQAHRGDTGDRRHLLGGRSSAVALAGGFPSLLLAPSIAASSQPSWDGVGWRRCCQVEEHRWCLRLLLL
jgi:glycosyl transferase family 4